MTLARLRRLKHLASQPPRFALINIALINITFPWSLRRFKMNYHKILTTSIKPDNENNSSFFLICDFFVMHESTFHFDTSTSAAIRLWFSLVKFNGTRQKAVEKISRMKSFASSVAFYPQRNIKTICKSLPHCCHGNDCPPQTVCSPPPKRLRKMTRIRFVFLSRQSHIYIYIIMATRITHLFFYLAGSWCMCRISLNMQWSTMLSILLFFLNFY